MNRRSVWDDPNPIVIAHRGGLEFAPENSLDAFRTAGELGIDYLESDVHVTADGVLVAFHDERLDRVTDGTGLIADLPFSEVSTARLEGGRSIPTFDELVESFPDAKLNIDVKADGAVVPFVQAVRRHGIIERVGVAAFSDSRIRRLRNLLGPRVSTVASPKEVSTLIALAGFRRGGARQKPQRVAVRTGSRFDAIQVPLGHGPVPIVNRRLVNFVHGRGVKVHVWTINDRAEMERLLDMEVDGIITDNPAVLKELLIERGQWSDPVSGIDQE